MVAGVKVLTSPAGLHEAFVDKLRDAYDAEKQLLRALPKLARAANDGPLRSAFAKHLEQTRSHVKRLQHVFESVDERARGRHCNGIAGIIEEGEAVTEQGFDQRTTDACLIAAWQRAKHYQMATYGTLVEWAKAMAHGKAAILLLQILEQERAASARLTQLAEGVINQ